jgi:hypothetical protein
MKYTEELIIKKALEEYQYGAANISIQKEKCAFLVIDMQDE